MEEIHSDCQLCIEPCCISGETGLIVGSNGKKVGAEIEDFVLISGKREDGRIVGGEEDVGVEDRED